MFRGSYLIPVHGKRVKEAQICWQLVQSCPSTVSQLILTLATGFPYATGPWRNVQRVSGSFMTVTDAHVRKTLNISGENYFTRKLQ
jgi:hypothetical protein